MDFKKKSLSGEKVEFEEIKNEKIKSEYAYMEKGKL